MNSQDSHPQSEEEPLFKIKLVSNNIPTYSQLYPIIGWNNRASLLSTTDTSSDYTRNTFIFFKLEQRTPFPLAYILDMPSSNVVKEAMQKLFKPPYFTFRFNYLHLLFDPDTELVTLCNDKAKHVTMRLSHSTFRICMALCMTFQDICCECVNTLRLL